ncbi:MAG: methionyl-tRNA formyltransferase [Armatimonadetes bacterium]|nr:methionyl-tRNA formyltransferase [Armatimonadota bacterium]MCX7968153.1 methionyl-tRNA formyltransferase [Armatimonadota bacterium]MDW8142037.1 methionyl-tRNA formyltransferase [Armatimonadota bacterium]
MRVVFLGTPEFAVPSLEAIVNSGHEVALVVTQPDKPAGRGLKLTPPPVKIASQNLGLTVFQPERLNEPESLKVIAEAKPEVLVVVAYGRILKEQCLAIPPKGCINVHPSLLPKYRGPAPIQHAILNGDEVTGVTTMFMDVGLDTGDIILQREVRIEPDDTAGTLSKKLSMVAADLLVETLRLLEQGDVPRFPQDHSQATYAPMLPPEIAHLDFSQPAKRLRNIIRALNPEPGAYSFFRGKRVKFWMAQVSDEQATLPPGTIVSVEKKSLGIATGNGLLLPTEIQTEGKKVLHVDEWLKGMKPLVGERFS